MASDLPAEKNMSEKAVVLTRDSIKQMYDLLKHLTTLDTGVIVILATFFSTSFENTSINWLIYICIGTIILSLISCVLGMLAVTLSLGLLGNSKASTKEIESSATSTRLAFFVSIFGFIVGVVSLAVFVVVNVKV